MNWLYFCFLKVAATLVNHFAPTLIETPILQPDTLKLESHP